MNVTPEAKLALAHEVALCTRKLNDALVAAARMGLACAVSTDDFVLHVVGGHPSTYTQASVTVTDTLTNAGGKWEAPPR